MFPVCRRRTTRSCLRLCTGWWQRNCEDTTRPRNRLGLPRCILTMSRSIFSNQWIGIEADSSGNRLDSRWVDAGHVRASTPHSCARVCTRVIELPESKSNNIALIGYTVPLCFKHRQISIVSRRSPVSGVNRVGQVKANSGYTRPNLPARKRTKPTGSIRPPALQKHVVAQGKRQGCSVPIAIDRRKCTGIELVSCETRMRP